MINLIKNKKSSLKKKAKIKIKKNQSKKLFMLG